MNGSQLPALNSGRAPLLLILCLYLLLGIGYSLATPLGEGPDEPGHIAYIAFLKEHGRLPRHGESDGPLAKQIKHPPLYYALGALATGPLSTEGLAFRPNPHFSANIDSVPSPSAHQHLPGDRFPYAESHFAMRLVRLLTVLYGLVTVWAAGMIARSIWPNAPHLAWGSAAAVAFLPQFLFMQGVVNNDGLANMLAALALLTAVRVVLRGARSPDLLRMGVVLGLGLVTKLTLVAVVAVCGLAVLAAAYRGRSARIVARAALWTGAPMLVISGWWFARNLRLAGDLMGWSRWEETTADLARRTPLSEDLQNYFLHQFESFWGRFGWMSVPLPIWLYEVLSIVALAALAGLVWMAAFYAWHRLRSRGSKASVAGGLLSTEDARWGFAVLVTTVALVYVSIFRLAFTLDLVVAQGRYLFTGLAAAAALFALGLAAWFPPRLQPAAMFAMAAGMFACAVYALVAVLAPAFSPPPRLTQTEIAAIDRRVDVDFGPAIRLLGYDLDSARFDPGDTVPLTLYWESIQPMDEGYIMFVQVLDGRGNLVGQVDVIPQSGRYPTLSWLPDWPFRETLEIPFAEWAAPREASVIVGLYAEGRPDARLRAKRNGGEGVGPFGDTYVIPIEISP